MNKKTAAERKAAALSKKRRAASAKGLAARWGESREASRQVRIDAVAASALQTVPERERRRVASDAIRAGVAAYLAERHPSASTAGAARLTVSSSTASKV